MKELDELLLPDDVKYSDDHEWAREGDGAIRVGISDYAQDQLGDIVYVELPQVGAKVTRNGEFGVVESVKAVSELLSPVGGTVVAVNDRLESDPGAVKNSPYGDGWMIDVKPDSPADMDDLMNRTDYLAFLQEG